MQFANSLLFAALTSFVAAQNAGTIPQCALQCFGPAYEAAGCAQNDQVCGCTTGREAITASATPCVIENCPIDQAVLVQSAAEALCSSVLAATSAGAPATTAAPSGEQSSVGATPATTSAGDTANSVVSSVGSAATSAAPTTGAGSAYRAEAGLVAAGLGLAAALM